MTQKAYKIQGMWGVGMYAYGYRAWWMLLYWLYSAEMTD